MEGALTKGVKGFSEEYEVDDLSFPDRFVGLAMLILILSDALYCPAEGCKGGSNGYRCRYPGTDWTVK